MICFDNVSLYLETSQHYLIEQLSFKVQEGETLMIVGASGAGKSTILKMLNRLIHPTSGEIKIGKHNIQSFDINELRYQLGYVFQHSGLFPHFTVFENIILPLKIQNKNLSNVHEKVNEILNKLNLNAKQLCQRYPHQLSGGQLQRVAIARTLIHDPPYLLMDEAFSALDTLTKAELQNHFIHLKQDLRKTIMMVTHDIEEALKLGDRIAIIDHGKLLQIGTPSELIEAPADKFVRKIFKKYRDKVEN